MKSRKEIEAVLQDIKDFPATEPDAILTDDGWKEALRWVLLPPSVKPNKDKRPLRGEDSEDGI